MSTYRLPFPHHPQRFLRSLLYLRRQSLKRPSYQSSQTMKLRFILSVR